MSGPTSFPGEAIRTGTIAAARLPTGIDAAKIADGSVSNAEFQRLNGVTSDIQTQLDGKLVSSGVSAFGAALIDDADAATARSTLGLGTLATQSGTFSGTSSGTNTGDQNTFGAVAVSGQSDVVADAANDTLTLEAGSGISITTNAITDTVTIAATGSSGLALHPGYVTGLYYSGTPCIAPGTMVLAANRLYYVGFPVVESVPFTRIGINVTSSVASSTGIRLGIYANSGGLPSGSPLLDAGTVSAATALEKEITINQSLSAGWIWLALASEGTATITAENGLSSGDMVRFNLGSSTGAGSHILYYFQSHVYGALPAVGSLTAVTGAGNIPRVWLRKT